MAAPCNPLLDRLRDGHTRAAQSLDSGAARELLERWVTVSRALRDEPGGALSRALRD